MKLKLICHNCGHEWIYKGKSQYLEPCPRCKSYKVFVKTKKGEVRLRRR